MKWEEARLSCERAAAGPLAACVQGLAAAVERRGGKIFEGTKAWTVGELRLGGWATAGLA